MHVCGDPLKGERRDSRVAVAAGKMLTTGVTLNRLNTLLSELRIASRNGSLVVDTCSGRGAVCTFDCVMRRSHQPRYVRPSRGVVTAHGWRQK